MIWLNAAIVLAAVVATASEEIFSNGTSRILGGVVSNFRQQPFVVQVKFQGKFHIGAATMLGPRLAVTAAQVTYKLEACDIRIRVNNDRSSHERGSHERGSHQRGSHERRSREAHSGQSRSDEHHSHERDDDNLYEVLKIIEHTCYDPLTQDNDIAILKLLEPIRLKGYALLPLFFEEPVEGSAVAISGWGTQANLHPDYSRELKTVVLEVIDFQKCNLPYRQFLKPSCVFCVGAKRGVKDACQGDLGSPVIDVASDMLKGIVGWAYGCGDFYRVVTKVSRYVHFIKINSS